MTRRSRKRVKMAVRRLLTGAWVRDDMFSESERRAIRAQGRPNSGHGAFTEDGRHYHYIRIAPAGLRLADLLNVERSDRPEGAR